jgi:hypothetical protein
VFSENRECEGLNCSSPAINEVRVKVGEKGAITLFLCETCRLKFEGDRTLEQAR